MVDADTTRANQEKCFKTMIDEKEGVTSRYMAFYQLKSIGGPESAQLLKKAFPYQGESELLKHEIAYTLGQMKFPELASFFKELVADESQYPIVRHEAAEALGNLNEREHIEFLSKYLDSKVNELRQTCEVAINRIKDERVDELTGQKFGGTLEPAVPYSKDALVATLEKTYQKDRATLEADLFKYIYEFVTDAKQPLYLKYKMIYYLRDLETVEAVKLLGKFLDPSTRDATGVILRHEIGFIAGQLSEKAKPMEEDLKRNIADTTESSIVRHEAIAGYGSCDGDLEFLKKYLDDEERVVRESIIVAIDMVGYWND